MIIYFISGLGADERIYGKIRLPVGYEMQHIPWEPVGKGQDIASYARQLARRIDAGRPFMLAGLSFGGMMAIEICKFLRPQKLILFSTVKTAAELPALYRLAGKLKLYNILPWKIYRLSLPFLYWFVGANNEASRTLLRSFLEHTDPGFLKWAVGEICSWKNTEIFSPYVHIHGEEDVVFPYKGLRAGHTIKGGTHFAVFDDAERINTILAEELGVFEPDRIKSR